MKKLLSLLFLIPFYVYAQEPVVAGAGARPVLAGHILGTVRDTAGQPIRHALVLVKHDSLGLENRVLSDTAGRYIIDGLFTGKAYTVAVARAGYEPEIWTDVSVPDMNAVTIDFRLDRNPDQDPNGPNPIPGLTITTRKDGSPLERKYLGYSDVQAAQVANALQLVEQLRPGILEPQFDICTPKDTLALFINSQRQLRGANPTVVTEYPARPGQPLPTPPLYDGKNPKDFIKERLKNLPKGEVFDVKYIGCVDRDPLVPMRNVIWVTTVSGK